MTEEVIPEVIVDEVILSQEELDAIEAQRIADDRIAEEARIEDERIAEEARIEVERVIEEARIKDIRYRYKNLKDHRAAGAALGISNIDLHVNKDIISNVDKDEAERLMVELETKDQECHVVIKSTEYISARKSEYRSIEEVIHTILDHGLDSQEFIDLQNERAAIKAKHPKE